MARYLSLIKLHDALSRKLFTNISPSITAFRLNSTFRAACLKEYGKPLVIDEFTRVPLNPKQVRVEVKYCSLNINDIKYLEESKESDKKLPFIPGYELSGEIIEVGEGCDSNVSVGQRVVGVKQTGNGGLATEAVVRASNIWELHPEIPYPDAAALVCGHSTALLAFSQHAQLNEGDNILVIAGAGGHGLAAVEVASTIFKAKVFAVTDTDGNASLLRDRGAFAAFRINKNNFKEIMKATENKGVAVIYDAVGGPSINTLIKCIVDLQKGSVIGTYRLKKEVVEIEKESSKKRDTESEDKIKVEAKDEDSDKEEQTQPKEKEGSSKKETQDKVKKVEAVSQEVRDKFRTVNIFNYRDENHQEFYGLISQVLEYYEEELISAHVSQTFSLEEVNEAIKYIKSKTCTGKVLIKIKDD